jgi:predicted dienelactone hydrolase
MPTISSTQSFPEGFMLRSTFVATFLGFAFMACGGDGTKEAADAGRDLADLPADAIQSEVADTALEADVEDAVVPIDVLQEATDLSADIPDVTPCAPYEGYGSWVVGVRTLDLPDRKVEVWYPAPAGSEVGKTKARYDMREWLPPVEAAKIPNDALSYYVMEAYRDLPVADGPFPMALFSHGVASFRSQSSALTTHLASWGFVVAAPDHWERGLASFLTETADFNTFGDVDLRATIALMEAETKKAGGPFEGRIDVDRIGATGHSLGGAAVMKLMEESSVMAGVTWAGPLPSIAGVTVTKPLMQISGSIDGIVPPGDARGTFASLAGWPKGFAEILGAGHLAFSDLCLVGADRGGIIQMALSYGVSVPDFLVELGMDGCRPADLPAVQAWPIIRHYTLAHLRLAMGIDAVPVGMGDEAAACFASRLVDWGFEAKAPVVPDATEPSPDVPAIDVPADL